MEYNFYRATFSKLNLALQKWNLDLLLPPKCKCESTVTDPPARHETNETLPSWYYFFRVNSQTESMISDSHSLQFDRCQFYIRGQFKYLIITVGYVDPKSHLPCACQKHKRYPDYSWKLKLLFHIVWFMVFCIKWLLYLKFCLIIKCMKYIL